MAYSLPTFNLPINVWRAGNPTTNPPDLIAACNLTFGRITAPSAGIAEPLTGLAPNYMFMCVPKLTDVRDQFCPAGADVVEVPAASGRFYNVAGVDDSGKGFQNEHRICYIIKTGVWPEPIP